MDSRNYFNQLKTVLDGIPSNAVAELVELIKAAGRDGKFIYLFGNGGSGANATHFTQDLLKCPIKFYPQSPQLVKSFRNLGAGL
jgi:D-sedoheptulose 7-phosphate isomerase